MTEQPTMANIYLELELSLDPPITEETVFKAELNRKIAEWTTLAAADAKYDALIGKAKTYLDSPLKNLHGQATEAKNTQLKKLREEVRNLGSNGGLMQFEIKYLTTTYSCFREQTVQEEIKKHSRSLVDGSDMPPNAVTKVKLPPLPSVAETFNATFDKIRMNMPFSKGSSGGGNKTIGKIILAILLAFVALYCVCSLPRLMPTISLTSTSYQRGVGPYIVRYANKNYSGKEWKPFDTNGAHVGDYIAGWDKDNFCVYRGRYSSGFANYKNGQWVGNDAGSDISRLFYSEPGTMYVITDNGIRVYGNESYRNTASQAGFRNVNIFFLKNDEYLFVTNTSPPNYMLLSKGVLSDMSRQDALKRFGQDFVDNGHNFRNAFFFRPHHAIACDRWETLAKCVNDKWSEHYKTTHNGVVNVLWAIDHDNFVLVGDDITVFKDGKESHPLVDSGEYFFWRNNCQAVWGNSINLFWVMDSTGCIAEFRDGKAGKVVVPGNFNGVTSHWVSPEGVVFVISDGGLYKLE